jgi:hypothetical protein
VRPDLMFLGGLGLGWASGSEVLLIQALGLLLAIVCALLPFVERKI